MSDSIEALGGLVDAALVAAATDRGGPVDAAETAHAHHRCANCDTPLVGHFCSNCGQKAHVHRSLVHVGEEFLHGITHFDGKAWQTLPMLAFRPGRLTRDYIMGKRARYIAPVPLFLLVVFLMFFVFSFVSFDPGSIAGGATDTNGKQMTQDEAARELPNVEAELRDLDQQIAAAEAKGDTVALYGLRGARSGVVATRDVVKSRASGKLESPFDLPGAIAAELEAEGSDGKVNVQLGSETLNQKVRKALKNPELVLYKIQGKAYKLSFLLVPLSVPWLWLLFAWKREVRMYDHAVFALYSISFMSLLFVIGSVAASMSVQNTGFWFALIVGAPLVHMFAQLKGAYALTNAGAAWRTMVLALSACFSLAIYAALMVVIGVLD